MTHWDPLPTVRACAYSPPWGDRPHDPWAERDWRNVPGPFYGAGTDTCWGWAVRSRPQEFVYRQPRDTEETYRLIAAAFQDPMAGYQCDGDDHWTPELVRDWWRERGRVREWAVALDRTWSVSQRADEREAAAGARDYVAHIDEGLGDRLRGYAFWLAKGRPAGPDENLPNL